MAEAAARAGWTVTGAKLLAFRARNKLKALIERGDSCTTIDGVLIR